MCLLGVQVVTDNPADFKSIVAMRGNLLRAALMGGDAGDPNDRPMANLIRGLRDRIGADGFPIPERFTEQLGRFDTNNDRRLSTKEIDAMPEGVRNRVCQAIQLRLGTDRE
jgi:hypothetical protein